MGILGTVLLSVYSGTTFAIFIEIGLYLTEKEQKISWHSFLRHGVYQGSTALVSKRRIVWLMVETQSDSVDVVIIRFRPPTQNLCRLKS